MRVFCSTHLCTHQAAQLCHMRQQIATLRAQLDAAMAERDALAAQLAGLQAAAQGATESYLFYLDAYTAAVKEGRV